MQIRYGEEEWRQCTTSESRKTPKLKAWPVDEVVTLVTDDFSKRAGVMMDYFKVRKYDNATLNQLLSWMTDNQATGESAAQHFLKNNQAIWTKWLEPEIAEKVQVAL